MFHRDGLLRIPEANMKTLALLSFVGFIALSSGSKCCSPPQWERSEIIDGTEVINGTMVPVKGAAQTAYDAQHRKLVTKYTIMRGGKSVQAAHVLSDYSTGMKYSVTEGVCTKSALTGPFPEACIPDNASQGIPMYFGAGDQKIMVTNYIVSGPHRMSSLLVTENCVPFSNTTSSTEGPVPFVVSFGYNGTTLGIADPSVFDIPPACPHEHKVTDVPEKKTSQVCCFPKQFESPGGMLGLVDVNGRAMQQFTTLVTSFDAINQKTVTRSNTTIENSPTSVSIDLKDYNAGMQYEVKNGVCKKGPLMTPFPDTCTPANATFRSAVLGSGANALKARIYNYMYTGGINMTIILTEDCVPVSESLDGHVGPNVEYWYSLGYSALTIGIKDPSVFDVPASCKGEVNHAAPVVTSL